MVQMYLDNKFHNLSGGLDDLNGRRETLRILARMYNYLFAGIH